jgi:hypothetical protein
MARFDAVIECDKHLLFRMRPDFMITLALTKQLKTSAAQSALQLRANLTHGGSGGLNDI